MSDKIQLNKNVELSGKLADYLAKSSSVLKKYKNSSYVVFSEKDIELNKVNEKLAKVLHKEGNKVVKAIQPKTSKGDWTFEPFFV